MLGDISKEFDLSKGILVRSKDPGHHAAAWCIIKETHSIGSDPVAVELDRWRDKFDLQVETSFRETKEALTTLGQEYEYHIQDMQFIEKSASYRTRLRIAIKAENVRCKMWLGDIRKAICHTEDSIDNSNSFNDLYKIFENIEEIRTQLVYVANHFECFPPGVSIESFQLNSEKIKTNSWKEWFDE